MLVKLKDVKAADKILKSILNTKMDMKLAYRMKKILGKITPYMDKIDEQGNALVRKHGTLNESGQGYNVAPDKLDAFTADFVAFLDDPTEINIEKIPFDMLEQIGIKLSPDEMITLESFIEEPAE